MNPHQSFKGYYLLDSGRLGGSFFEKAVIFLCQHDADGAFGFIVNRPSGSVLSQVMDTDLTPHTANMDLFVGGPVQPEVFSFLHADSSLIQSNIVPGIEFSHSLETLTDILGAFSAGAQVRAFGGYSGWGRGQLEQELEQGSWLLHQSSTEHIFSKSPSDVWAAILSEMGPRYRLLADFPDDPSRN